MSARLVVFLLLLLGYSSIDARVLAKGNESLASPAQPQSQSHASEDIARLRAAAVQGDSKQLEELLTANPGLLDYRFRSGDSSLTLAVSAGHTAAARLLLARGANPNVQSRVGMTSLHMASLNGNLELVLALLAHGADPNKTANRDGWTALIFAARDGRLEVVKALLNAGANVNASIVDGNTALHWARAQRHAEVARVLEAAGGQARGSRTQRSAE